MGKTESGFNNAVRNLITIIFHKHPSLKTELLELHEENSSYSKGYLETIKKIFELWKSVTQDEELQLILTQIESRLKRLPERKRIRRALFLQALEAFNNYKEAEENKTSDQTILKTKMHEKIEDLAKYLRALGNLYGNTKVSSEYINKRIELAERKKLKDLKK